MNRRYKLGILWVVLITVPYYLCMFKGMDLEWWVQYAKQMTFWFAIIVGGLSVTDIAYQVKEGFKKNGIPPTP